MGANNWRIVCKGENRDFNDRETRLEMEKSMILLRLRNLWKLSEYEPRKLQSDPVKEGTVVAQIIKKPTDQKASFIPRFREKPIDKVTRIANDA